VAAKAHRKWDKLYTLQPAWGAGLRQNFTGAEGTNMLPPQVSIQSPLSPEERAAVREREFEAQLATMTPKEREMAQEQRQMMQEINALPPAERQQRLDEMAGANAGGRESGVLERMQDRLKNMTPEQRVERDRARLERLKRQQQNQ